MAVDAAAGGVEKAGEECASHFNGDTTRLLITYPQTPVAFIMNRRMRHDDSLNMINGLPIRLEPRGVQRIQQLIHLLAAHRHLVF